MVMPASEKNLQNIKEALIKILAEYLSGKEYLLFMFGSQATCDRFGASDIDIGIIAEKRIEPSQLNLIKEKVEEKAQSLRKIEIIDFNSADDPIFVKSALRRVKIWHETPKSKIFLENLKKHFNV
jgi:predicted nucleotidyltransferase